MTKRFRLPLIALVLAAPAQLAAQDASDFRLPTPSPTPTVNPNVQGPVDTESGNLPVRPRDLTRPRQQPVPSPTPSQTQTPRLTVQPLPTPEASPRASRPAGDQPSVRQRQQPQSDVQQSPTPLPTSAPRTPIAPVETTPLGQDFEPAPEPSVPDSTGTALPDPVEPLGSDGEAERPGWLWPAWGLGMLALLGGAFVFLRRRNALVAVPEIERPVVPTGSDAGTAGAVSTELQIKAEAIKLTRSVAYATLQYRVTLINRSAAALSDVDLGADIVSAHGGLPMEEQVATAANRLEKRHNFSRIAPGQSVRHDGEIRIPLSQARIIRQGSASLFVPLLRVRIDLADGEPVLRTFVVGQGVPDGGRVTPFRLDEGPRSYAPVAARALD